MITDEFLDEMARVLVPRMEDLARRWTEEAWQLYKPPQLGEYHYWNNRQMMLPVMREDNDG